VFAVGAALVEGDSDLFVNHRVQIAQRHGDPSLFFGGPLTETA